jgi:hypothetical protein
MAMVPPFAKRARVALSALVGVVCAFGAPRAGVAGQPREGLYFEASMRGTYELGRYTYDTTSTAGQPLHYVAPVHASGGGLELAFGHSIRRGLALAVDAGFGFATVAKDHSLPWTTLEGTSHASVGVLLDAYPHVDRGAHVQLGLAYVTRSFAWSQADIGASDNVVEVEALHGLRARIGGGFRLAGDAATGVDVRVRVDVTYAWRARTTMTSVAPGIELGVTSF